MLNGVNASLRPVEETDLELLQRWNNDPEFKGMYESIECSSLKEYRDWFNDPGDSVFFLILDHEEAPVGQIMYRKKDDYLAVGYIIHPDHRNRGFCTEAVQLLVDYLFLATKTERIEAATNPENTPSSRVLEKAGFTYEGTLRRANYIRGEYMDAATYSILRDEWNKPRALKTG